MTEIMDKSWELAVNKHNEKHFPSLQKSIKSDCFSKKCTGKYLKMFLEDDNNINDANPIQVGQIIKQYFPDHLEQAKMRGAIMIRTKDNRQFDSVMNLKTPVTVTMNGVTKTVKFEEMTAKNISKGIIFEKSWSHLTTEEILTELKKEGQAVREIKQIVKKVKEGEELKEIKTNGYILTFDAEEIPERVRLCGMSYRIRPYYPNPLICIQCLKPGHTKVNCKQQHTTCRNCGGVLNVGHTCGSPICPNCPPGLNNHPPNGKGCGKMEFEREVIQRKINHRIPHPQAEREVRSMYEQSERQPNTQWTESVKMSTTSVQPNLSSPSLSSVSQLEAEIERQTEELKKVNALQKKLDELNVELTIKWKQVQETKRKNQILINNINSNNNNVSVYTEPAKTRRENEDLNSTERSKIQKRSWNLGKIIQTPPDGYKMITSQIQWDEIFATFDEQQKAEFEMMLQTAKENNNCITMYVNDLNNVCPVTTIKVNQMEVDADDENGLLFKVANPQHY